MTERNDTPQRLTLVAIDIAKHCHDVLVEPPPPKRRLRTPTTSQAFCRMRHGRGEFEAYVLMPRDEAMLNPTQLPPRR